MKLLSLLLLWCCVTNALSYTLERPYLYCTRPKHILHNSRPSLHAAADSTDNNKTTSMIIKNKLQKKIASRKKRVEIGYALSSAGYAIFIIIALLKYSFSYSASFISSGLILPSGISFILKKASTAADENRLSSDTYKRLNLALGTYGVIGLLSNGIIAKPFRFGWTITNLCAIINSIKGFGYGLKGWDLKKVAVLPEFVDGAKATVLTMIQIRNNNISSAGYQLSAWSFFVWNILTLRNLVDVYFSSKGLLPPLLLQSLAFRIKKIMLLMVISFTLKDAADRKRLGGTTFRELNFLNSVASAVLAAYYFHQSLIIGGAALALNSIFCASNGMTATKK